MTSIYDDLNPDFITVEDAWEPWQDDEGPDVTDTIGGCAYCGAPDVREDPEPFGQQPCCDQCFNRIIGDDDSNPRPWRCGHDRRRPWHPMVAVAAARTPVTVRRPGHPDITARLTYWAPNGASAKVQLPSGAYLSIHQADIAEIHTEEATS